MRGITARRHRLYRPLEALGQDVKCRRTSAFRTERRSDFSEMMPRILVFQKNVSAGPFTVFPLQIRRNMTDRRVSVRSGVPLFIGRIVTCEHKSLS